MPFNSTLKIQFIDLETEFSIKMIRCRLLKVYWNVEGIWNLMEWKKHSYTMRV